MLLDLCFLLLVLKKEKKLECGTVSPLYTERALNLRCNSGRGAGPRPPGIQRQTLRRPIRRETFANHPTTRPPLTLGCTYSALFVPEEKSVRLHAHRTELNSRSRADGRGEVVSKLRRKPVSRTCADGRPRPCALLCGTRLRILCAHNIDVSGLSCEAGESRSPDGPGGPSAHVLEMGSGRGSHRIWWSETERLRGTTAGGGMGDGSRVSSSGDEGYWGADSGSSLRPSPLQSRRRSPAGRR